MPLYVAFGALKVVRTTVSTVAAWVGRMSLAYLFSGSVLAPLSSMPFAIAQLASGASGCLSRQSYAGAARSVLEGVAIAQRVVYVADWSWVSPMVPLRCASIAA